MLSSRTQKDSYLEMALRGRSCVTISSRRKDDGSVRGARIHHEHLPRFTTQSHSFTRACASRLPQLLARALRAASSRMRTFRPRDRKRAPPHADVFGWCTWDAFYSTVSADAVRSGLASLRDALVPARFVIIDDGWQDVAPAPRYRSSARAATDGQLSGEQLDASAALGATTATAATVAGDGGAGKADNEVVAAAKKPPGGLAGLCEGVTAWASQNVVLWYQKHVEENPNPDAFAVRLWALACRTVLKGHLLAFFAEHTDFSKRLVSFRANSKFEAADGDDDEIELAGDAAAAAAKARPSLKSLVSELKGSLGVEHVHVWHALTGYWGGVSSEAEAEAKERARDGGCTTAQQNAAAAATTAVSATTVKGWRIAGRFASQRRRVARRLGRGLSAATASRGETMAVRPAAAAAAAADAVKAAVATKAAAAARAWSDSYVAFSSPTPHLLRVEPGLAWSPCALGGVAVPAGSAAASSASPSENPEADAAAQLADAPARVFAQVGSRTTRGSRKIPNTRLRDGEWPSYGHMNDARDLVWRLGTHE